MGRLRTALIWAGLASVIAIPLIAAASSPLLAWRQPVYIAAGFAGVIAMALLLMQPILAAGYLPGLDRRRARHLHRWTGAGLVLAVVIHVAALWITSPPDVIDVLLFDSPTPFSVWGVLAMWATFFAAGVAALRARLRLRAPAWRRLHTGLAAMVVAGSVVHAVLIEGTMETVSKAILCVLVIGATAKALIDLRIWTIRARSR